MEENLYRKLALYSKSDVYPFHMPGHKRRFGKEVNPYKLDITEIDGFDNLHHPGGILKEAQERAERLYHGEHSFFLVNGSTGGILSSIGSCTKPGDKILIGRNCHKSVYHASCINRLKTEYCYPEVLEFGISGSITPEEIKHSYEKDPNIKVVIITSPTYDGIVSDLREIAKIVHAYEGILIVDAAHGAHLGFHSYFPENPVTTGADIIIMSLHKTLPAFTQSALLHVNSTGIKIDRIKHYLNMYETSSPSYLLMAGMDACLELVEKDGAQYFEKLKKNLEDFYSSTGQLKHLKVFERTRDLEGSYDFDPSKLLISTKGIGGDFSGKRLSALLREKYRIELEMSSLHYATALSGIMDEEEGFCRLGEALLEIDSMLEDIPVKEKISLTKTYGELYAPNEKRMELFEAEEERTASCGLMNAPGKISAEYAYLYPPGIPILVPGEVVCRDFEEKISYCRRQGFQVEGLEGGKTLKYIEI